MRTKNDKSPNSDQPSVPHKMLVPVSMSEQNMPISTSDMVGLGEEKGALLAKGSRTSTGEGCGCKNTVVLFSANEEDTSATAATLFFDTTVFVLTIGGGSSVRLLAIGLPTARLSIGKKRWASRCPPQRRSHGKEILTRMLLSLLSSVAVVTFVVPNCC